MLGAALQLLECVRTQESRVEVVYGEWFLHVPNSESVALFLPLQLFVKISLEPRYPKLSPRLIQ